MQPSARRGLFAGIAILSFATVVLQVVFLRLYSAIYGQHIALLATSLAVLGIGLGGVALHVVPSIAPKEALLGRAAILASLASGATLVALLVLLHFDPIETFDQRSLGRLAVIFAVSAAPFIFIGIALAAAVRHAASDIARLYLVDLLGAAVGGLGAIAVLKAGAPRAVVMVAIALSAAAVLLYAVAHRIGERPTRGALVATFALVSTVLFAGDFGKPWLKLPPLRFASIDQVEFEGWNDMALVTVDRPTAGTAWMRSDGTAATSILDPKTSPPAHPAEMGYVLHQSHGPVLVLGAGGGRDVRAALKNGQKDVYAVEVNPIIVDDAMQGRYRTFSGDLFSRPEVHLTVADGRSYVRRSPYAFRDIVISLADTSAASATGALVLTKDSLYTVEALQDDLRHLTPDGVLVADRPDGDFDRLLALATEALRREASEKPSAHLFACSATHATALLIKRTPLAPDEIGKLRHDCQRYRFTEVFAPDDPHGERHEKLASLDRAAAADEPIEISPPTDDRPFFFYTLKLRGALDALAHPSALKASSQGVLILFGLLVASIAIALLLLLVPLAVFPARLLRAVDARSRGRALGYFLALGAGFAFVDVAVVQDVVMFLGHPVYALSTVWVALLLWSGVGSVLTGRVDEALAASAARQRAGALAVLLAVFAVALGPLLGVCVGLPFFVRLALSVILLAPLGILMGSVVPLGVKLLAARAPDILAWCWGLAGLAALVATAFGAWVAVQFGFSSLLVLGGACYLFAALVVPAWQPTAEATDFVPTE